MRNKYLFLGDSLILHLRGTDRYSEVILKRINVDLSNLPKGFNAKFKEITRRVFIELPKDKTNIGKKVQIDSEFFKVTDKSVKAIEYVPWYEDTRWRGYPEVVVNLFEKEFNKISEGLDFKNITLKSSEELETSAKEEGGFSWHYSSQGRKFWSKLITAKNFEDL